jgi:hypothetical protein
MEYISVLVSRQLFRLRTYLGWQPKDPGTAASLKTVYGSCHGRVLAQVERKTRWRSLAWVGGGGGEGQDFELKRK